MSVIFALYSCIHDEVYASPDSSYSKEYASKSLWKEDEKYIKNVMKIYFEHEEEIKKMQGHPYWDYSVTRDFEESFLMVPVVRAGNVVSVLKVPRKGKMVYFIYTSSVEEINFFQNLISARVKKAVNNEASGITSRTECTTKTFGVWMPYNENDADPSSGNGYWQYQSVTTCKVFNDLCAGYLDENGNCVGFDGGGYDYGGGEGGDEEPESEEENPCEKAKTILADPAVQAKINELKGQSKIKEEQPGYGEKAFVVNNDGTSSSMIDGEEHLVRVGSILGQQGVYHNHTPDGIKMTSPPDIIKMLHYALSQPNGNITNGFLGLVGSEVCSTCPGGYKYHNYVIRFSGTLQELGTFTSQNWDRKILMNDYMKTKDELSSDSNYANYKYGPLTSNGLEKLFFATLKNMGIEGKVNLQRIDNNGTIQNITFDSNGNSTAIPCP
ncbi:hypothetical protein [Chryseobacterium terrae]|uniref:Uncharacterized protein n=1 Tax=Chryseobacterium terrae TaxID=3163299 RepID=A0ABW8Y805_9FLAO